MKLKSAIRLVLSASALALAVPAQAQEVTVLEEIIVTAQKREENVQDVPIAVTAFTADGLAMQKIDGARDLQLGVPNMNYSRAGYGKDNFQIRGIGEHVISVGGDSGVGVHENNTPLAVSRIADVDFYDVTRVEVLRGPQGTLYGRNATGGVVNVITTKPKNEFGANIALDGGNYSSKKVSGFINLPMGDSLALRVAGMGIDRDGYMTDATTGDAVDGRKLWSSRATLGFTPSDSFNVSLMWEHFHEADDRTAGGKTLCIKDLGPTSIGGVATNALTRSLESHGCLQSAIDDPAARTGTVNSMATLGGLVPSLLPNAFNFMPGDAYAGKVQSPDLRTIELSRKPVYEAQDEFAQLDLQWKWDSLKFTSLTAFSQDSINSSYDSNTFQPSVPFAVTAFTPGGISVQPQVGAYDRLQSINTNDLSTRQWTQELRLQSSGEGAWNFNVGGIYMHLKRLNQVYIFVNTETTFSNVNNFGNPNPIYIDPLASPDTTGHNYFLVYQPYELRGKAAFGELYWQAANALKFTLGLRYTDDSKHNLSYPIGLLAPGRGWPFTNSSGVQTIKVQDVEFKETTGRFNAEWKLSDDSLLYASYSKGYKGGGFNSPDIVSGSATYRPEFVNAIELGSKNAFFERSLLLNLTAFSYDYQDYQISKINGFSAITDNVDAKIRGVELETVWHPVKAVRLNANVGWLKTEIQSGSAVDPENRTQGDPTLAIAKSITGACVMNATALGNAVALANAGTITPAQLLGGACAGAFGGSPNDGVKVDLAGKELPTSPHLTASFGAQLDWAMGNWDVSLRGDYYHQSGSYSAVFNNWSDKLDAYGNVNATLTFAQQSAGWRVQLYGRNLTNEDVITSAPTQSDALGLIRPVTLLDPRLFGLVVSKSF